MSAADLKGLSAEFILDALRHKLVNTKNPNTRNLLRLAMSAPLSRNDVVDKLADFINGTSEMTLLNNVLTTNPANHATIASSLHESVIDEVLDIYMEITDPALALDLLRNLIFFPSTDPIPLKEYINRVRSASTTGQRRMVSPLVWNSQHI